MNVAVLIPCYNEAHAIAKVVADFRAALPEATVYVYDNNSTDGTGEVAQAAGAVVRREVRQGKGYVVRRMFNDVEADVYALVDGDATYDAPSAPAMIAKLVDEQLDMVVATRVESEGLAYRRGHRIGNRLLTGFVAHIFGHSFTDMLSGYRIFSRRFVKSFPILSGGFRDRDGIDGPCARARIAGRRNGDALLRAAERIGLEAFHLERRLPHSLDDFEVLPRRTAAAAVRRIRRSARASRRSDWQSRSW